MSCEEIRELFSDHIDGTLPVDAEERLARHVEACAGCREQLSRYKAATSALAELGPEPPPDLGVRVLRRLTSEGLLSRESRWGARRLLPLAASLAVFSIGFSVGRSTDRDRDPLTRPGPRVPMIAWADACAADPFVLPLLDPRALRALPEAEGPDRVVPAGPYSLHLPRTLISHGPYEPDVSASLEREGGTCLPLSAPFGTRLVLSVTPAGTGYADGARTFVVEIDPTRVLYARILWSRDGLSWSLEGRAEAAVLLDIAHEIAAGTQVKRAGTDQTL